MKAPAQLLALVKGAQSSCITPYALESLQGQKGYEEVLSAVSQCRSELMEGTWTGGF